MTNSNRRETMSYLQPVRRPSSEEMNQLGTRRRAQTHMQSADHSARREIENDSLQNKTLTIESNRKMNCNQVSQCGKCDSDGSETNKAPYVFDRISKDHLGSVFMRKSPQNYGVGGNSVVQSSTSTGSKIRSAEKGRPSNRFGEGEKIAFQTEEKSHMRTSNLFKISMIKPDEDSGPNFLSAKGLSNIAAPHGTDADSNSPKKKSISGENENKFTGFKQKLLFTNLIDKEDKITAKNSKVILRNGQEKIVSCLVWESGTSFEGDIVNMKFHGYGIFRHFSGYTIKGNFTAGMVDGKAEFYSSRKSYHGEWKDNQPHGVGIEKVDGVYEYDGDFFEGLKNGRGKMVIYGKGKYEGEFRSNTFHGPGTFSWGDGKKYNGAWFNNCMQGKGIMTWPDGRRYEGRYVKNRKEGFGVFTWADGRQFTGIWKDGKQNGEGKYTDLKGNKIEDKWKEGIKAEKQEYENE